MTGDPLRGAQTQHPRHETAGRRPHLETEAGVHSGRPRPSVYARKPEPSTHSGRPEPASASQSHSRAASSRSLGPAPTPGSPGPAPARRNHNRAPTPRNPSPASTPAARAQGPLVGITARHPPRQARTSARSGSPGPAPTPRNHSLAPTPGSPGLVRATHRSPSWRLPRSPGPAPPLEAAARRSRQGAEGRRPRFAAGQVGGVVERSGARAAPWDRRRAPLSERPRPVPGPRNPGVPRHPDTAANPNRRRVRPRSQQTATPPGPCSHVPEPPFRHSRARGARVAAAPRAADPGRNGDWRSGPRVLWTRPPIGTVGDTGIEPVTSSV
jgi:hypothetical protein